jgi:hypothetical protein
VATLNEIQDVEVSRDAAIEAGETLYFSPYLELVYTDLDIAIQARAQLDTRINELTRGWITYRDTFATDELTKLFPSSDPEVEEQAIQDYVDARDARQEAETAVALAAVNVEVAQTSVDSAIEFITVYEQQLAYLEQSNVEFNTYIGLIVNEGSAAVSYRNDPILLTYEAEWSAVTGKIQYWKNTKTQREQEYEAAVQAKIEADAELAAAQAAEDEALAAAVAANPDWDPSSV